MPLCTTVLWVDSLNAKLIIHTVCNKNVVQRVWFLVMHDLSRYLQVAENKYINDRHLLVKGDRTSALTRGTPLSKVIEQVH